MFKKIKLHQDPILILYFITAAILLLDMTNNFPMITILRKIKYVILIVMFMDALRASSFKLTKREIFVLVCLVIHTVIFGYLHINPTISEYIYVHARELFIYLAYLALSIEMIERKKCYIEYLECICSSFTAFFAWIAITHSGDFVNPLYFPMVLMRIGRIRTTFGTTSPNYIGYICFIALILYYLLWWTWKESNRLTRGRTQMLIGISIVVICILFSTASRSSIISLFVFAFCCFIAQFPKFIHKQRKLISIVTIIIIVIFIAIFGQDIWANANRSSNVTVNIPIMKEMNAELMGMGYAESSGFSVGIEIYGYKTFNVDNYYLYIYLSTGLVGTIIVAIPLLYILFMYLKNKKNTIQLIMLAAYIAMLFNAFWQVNLFTYRYIATVYISTLLLYFMNNKTEITEKAEIEREMSL